MHSFLFKPPFTDIVKENEFVCQCDRGAAESW